MRCADSDTPSMKLGRRLSNNPNSVTGVSRVIREQPTGERELLVTSARIGIHSVRNLRGQISQGPRGHDAAPVIGMMGGTGAMNRQAQRPTNFSMGTGCNKAWHGQ